MAKCVVCGNDVSTEERDSLIIKNVPESTFGFSKKTITIQVISCNFCGAVQLYNIPIDDNFQDVFRSMGVSKDYREDKKNQLNAHIKKYNLQNFSMVEIGCGDGQILEIFRELGYNVFGVETGNENSLKCTSKGFEHFHGSIEDIKIQYNAFFSFYHLEHFNDPIKFVTNLYRILKPGGIGLIEVPNYDHIEKNKIWLEFTKDHRIYYRKKTLSYLLLRCGFEIKSIKENTGRLCLTVIVRKPKSNKKFSSMKKKIDEDEKRFKKLVDRFNGIFVVYGCGHYAQLLINMIYNKYEIRPSHIFDSNPVKCGNKICGIEIIHKDLITKIKEVKNIIIICGMYTNEVYKILNELNFNNNYWENVIEWN